MGNDFGVGRGVELVPLALQTVLQGLEVLDHTVVDHGQRTVTTHVGMRVGVTRCTMRSPAGMADADPARGWNSGQEGLQPIDSAGRLDQGKLALGRDRGHARAVIATVFQAAKADHEELRRFPRPNVSNNSAHRMSLPARQQAEKVTAGPPPRPAERTPSCPESARQVYHASPRHGRAIQAAPTGDPLPGQLAGCARRIAPKLADLLLQAGHPAAGVTIASPIGPPAASRSGRCDSDSHRSACDISAGCYNRRQVGGVTATSPGLEV